MSFKQKYLWFDSKTFSCVSHGIEICIRNNVSCMAKLGSICSRRNVSATMFPGLARPSGKQCFLNNVSTFSGPLHHWQRNGTWMRAERSQELASWFTWNKSLKIYYGLFSLLKFIWYLPLRQTWCPGTGNSLNIAFCWYPSTNLGIVPGHGV